MWFEETLMDPGHAKTWIEHKISIFRALRTKYESVKSEEWLLISRTSE